jgi:ADP-ribosylglycohydrolase
MNKIIFNTFLAGWCGDASGATLEFKKQRFSKKEANNAMQMLKNSDSEMELALLNALIEEIDNDYFPIEKISQNYIEWFHSEPFDIGQTTTFALIDATNSDELIKNALEYNKDSESNGSLMRCIPLSIVLMNKDVNTYYKIIKLEVSLTHSNKKVMETTFLYCFIISQILKQRINNMEINISDLLNILKKYTKYTKSWLKIGIHLNTLNNYDCINHTGHVKHNFILFVYYLKNINNYTYEKAIEEVLMLGGDTDTNAKIIGNLFGAYYEDCVPDYMSNPVLNLDTSLIQNEYFKRPKKYCIKYNLELFDNILEIIKK